MTFGRLPTIVLGLALKYDFWPTSKRYALHICNIWADMGASQPNTVHAHVCRSGGRPANTHSHHQLMGKRLHSGRAGISPPRFSSQVLFVRSQRERPAGDAGRQQQQQQQQHDGVVHGAPPIIAPRGFPLTRSGAPIPLSLTKPQYYTKPQY